MTKLPNPIFSYSKFLLLGLLASVSMGASSQLVLNCEINAYTVELGLHESERWVNILWPYSKRTRCEFLADDVVFSKKEIRFTFPFHSKGCGGEDSDKSVKISVRIDRKSGYMFLKGTDDEPEMKVVCTHSLTQAD